MKIWFHSVKFHININKTSDYKTFETGDISETDPKSTLLQNLKKQGSIKKRLACLKLHQKDEPVGGEILIGGCDVEAEHWGRVSGNGLWQIPIDKIEAVGTDGKATASICTSASDVQNCQATLDSGADPIGKSLVKSSSKWNK